MPDESTALTVAQRAAVALNAPEHERKLKELATKSTAIVAIRDAASYQECHGARMTLKRTRIDIERLGKTARDDAQAFAKAVIAEEKRLIGIIAGEEERLGDLQGAWDAKIEAEREAKRQAEAARGARISGEIDAMRRIPILLVGAKSPKIEQRIAELQAREIDAATFEEFTAQAATVKSEVLEAMGTMLAAARAAEEEARQLAEQKANEARLAGIRTKIDAIRRAPLALAGCDSARLNTEVEKWRMLQLTPADFAELLDEAEAARADVVRELTDLYEAKLASEAEAARLASEAEALAARKAEQERIDREADEERRRKDEKARQEREEADRQARERREREEAEAKAAREEEERLTRERREAEERRLAADRTEIDRKRQEIEERQRREAEAKAEQERQAEAERRRQEAAAADAAIRELATRPESALREIVDVCADPAYSDADARAWVGAVAAAMLELWVTEGHLGAREAA